MRGEPRSVKRRTRSFRPNYLMLSPSYQCNLSCPHCSVPIEWPDRLEIPVALRFLEQAHAEGIEVLGFTGGEPFLYPEFLIAVTRRAAELGLRFDKVQTNGVWFRDPDHLTHVLEQLRDAGFTGKLGLSVDKFHGTHLAEVVTFCRVARAVFDRDNVVSLSYASRAPDQGLEPVRSLAKELDGLLEWSDWLHRYLLVTPEMTIVVNWNHLAPVERAERFAGAWDGVWFEEDYCEGPGQALIVTPRGEVKPCCGFANDLDQLTIGNVYKDSVKDIIQRGRRHPYVGKVFREGLTAIRDEILARDPQALPGATSNHCFFCWYVLANPVWDPQGERTAKVALSLPVIEAPTAGCSVTQFSMRFDGRTVFLNEEAPPTPTKGRVYRITARGPAVALAGSRQMTWNGYQGWIDRLRAEGYTLTTEDGGGCQAVPSASPRTCSRK